MILKVASTFTLGAIEVEALADEIRESTNLLLRDVRHLVVFDRSLDARWKEFWDPEEITCDCHKEHKVK